MRPVVPGPHDLDGLLPAVGDSAEPLQIVWLGDSLASGVGAETIDATFPRKAAALYGAAQGRSVHVTCLATAGAKTADVLNDQLATAVGRLGPGAVAVLLVGSNDVGQLTRPERFRREYSQVLDGLVATGATVIAVGLPDFGAATVMAQPLRFIAGRVGRRADRSVRHMAAARGAHYIDINCAPPKESMPLVYLAADNYHPNDVTYLFWADRLATFLHPILIVT